MNRKKNAFTLIELLAIIVILAIIAVITVPIILNIIENSKKGAAADSAYGYKDAVNKWYVQELSKPNNQNFNLSSSYTVEDGKLIDPTINNDEGILIPFSGDKPSSGYLNYSNNTLTSGCLVFGDYAVTFAGNTTSTVKGDCSSSSEQGGSGSEQTVVQTWDMYYYLDPENYSPVEATSWNNESSTWIQVNTTSGEKEVCTTFSDGTVCFTNDSSGRSSDFAACSSLGYDSETYDGTGETCIKGYTKTKADEMLSKGGYDCSIRMDNMDCYSSSGNSCQVTNDGKVYCQIDGYYYNVESNGNYSID